MWGKCHHCFCVVDVHFKGGVSDFWCPMLTFEITKTNTPLPRKDLAPMVGTSAQLPPLSLSVCNYISRFGTFAFHDRKAALSNFSSLLWYYSCEITNKKYIFHKWIVNFINIKSSSSSHFHLKFLGKFCLPDKPPLGVSLLLFRSRFLSCFLSALSIFCRRSARLMSVMCTDERRSLPAPYCWLATSLFWYSALTRFPKRFWKNTYPTF